MGDLSKEFEQVNIDPNAIQRLNSFTADSEKTPDQLVTQHTQGIEGGGGLLQKPSDGPSQALGGPADDQVRDALNARAQKSFGDDLGRIQNQAKLAAPQEAVDRHNQAQQLVNMRNQFEATKRAKVIAAKQQEEAARNSVIGSILGGIGSIVGGMIAGPPGAAIGGAAGKAAGG